MNKKYSIIILGFVGFLLLMVFVSSLEIIDIGVELGFPADSLTGLGVSYSESQEIIIIQFLIEGALLNVNGSIFKDIAPVTKNVAYIRLDSNLSIFSAEFTVSGERGIYRFNDEVIEVPNGTRVIFDKQTGINLDIPNGTNLGSFPSLLKYVSDQHLKLIRGKDIKISDDLKLIDGILRIDDNGYFLEKGQMNYNQNLLNVKNINDKILIVNPDADMSDYTRNWIRQTPDVLEIQSLRNGRINIEILEGHEILRTGGGDNLYIDVNRGDGLLFEKRETQGLIPRAVHRSSINGITYIKNNEISFELSENSLLMESPKPLTTEDFFGNRHQSVAFEIESDSPKIDTKVRFNSYGQFAILSNEDNEIIKYNIEGFPISAHARDNELTKIELRKRLIEEEEYVIPKEVMGSFAGIVDPNSPFGFVPSGGYMNADYLTSKRERNQFISELRKLDYNDDEIKSFIGIFREGNIVLGEHVLIEEQNFVEILAHERLHKDIYFLNSNDKSMLNKARDFIIDDLRTKEIRMIDEVSKFIPEYNEGKISFEEYKMIEREIIERHNPILLDKKREIGVDIATIINRPNEFYTYLYDGRLNPGVETYLRLNFPDSYRIYLQLTERIYGQINNRIGSIFN